MKLKLEALSPVEGIGIVRKDLELRLIRPPYRLYASSVLTEDSIHDAISKYGFFACSEEFSNWEEVIEFLNRKAVETRRSLGKEIPTSTPMHDILDVAPAEVLAMFLDRVERELIPQRMFDRAQDFLLALLKSKASARFPEISSRSAELLELNNNARKIAEDNVSELSSRDIRFLSLEKNNQSQRTKLLSQRIRERRCIFAMC